MCSRCSKDSALHCSGKIDQKRPISHWASSPPSLWSATSVYLPLIQQWSLVHLLKCKHRVSPFASEWNSALSFLEKPLPSCTLKCWLDPSSERGRVCGVHWQWCHSPPHPPHIANGVTYGGAQTGQGSAWGNRTSPCKSSWGFQWQCLTSGSRQWQGK